MTDIRKLKRVLASMPAHYDGSNKVTLLSENQEYWWFSQPERLAKLRALKLITVYAEPIEWDSNSNVGEQRAKRGQRKGIRYALRPRYYIPEFPAKVFRTITKNGSIQLFSDVIVGVNAKKTHGQLLEEKFLEYMLPWLEDRSQEENILALVELSVDSPTADLYATYARTSRLDSFGFLKASYDAHRLADKIANVDLTIKFMSRPDGDIGFRYFITKNRTSGPQNT